MKLSARNVLKGRVLQVVRGKTTGHVKLDVGGGTVITASITMEAIAELKLRRGDTAYAVIKASDVIVGKAKPSEASNCPTTSSTSSASMNTLVRLWNSA